MGFLSGLIGGITLTSTILYLSLSSHRHNRLQQSLALKHQQAILNSLTAGPEAQQPAAAGGTSQMMVMRVQRTSLLDRLKDRWNGDVEGVVRWVEGVDWRRVERGVERVWERVWERGGG